MFTKASFRLTAWYVAILMVLSLVFSVWLYTEASKEVSASLNDQRSRPYSNLVPPDEMDTYISQQTNASRWRIIGSLALMNVGVLVAGSFVSYFLARKTLQPIEQALDAQNRFTADASHELRTPLTAMKTEIEVALRNNALSTEDVKGLLESNVEEIDRLSKLANDLLILARVNEVAELKKVAVSEIAHKTCARFKVMADAKNIKIKQQIAPVHAMADESRIDTVLGILLDNAVKYSPEKADVTVAVATHDNQACLTVHNTGSYILAKDLPHVFERFYRADAARSSRKTAGHGLGLSIAQKLAANMSGTITVASSKEKGTTFTLRLALA